MADTGTYLYAVSAAATTVIEGVQGVAAGPLRAVERSGLVAYVSTVPLDEFGEGQLRRSLEDLEWVDQTARAHHRVVEAVAQVVATAPVRLVSIYRSDDQVGELLRQKHDDFVTVLSLVAGRSEWGVKAYGETAKAGSSAEDHGGDKPATGGPGTAFLRRRRTSLRSREDAWRAAAAQAERIHAIVGAIAVARRRYRPQASQLSGRDGRMVLNGAYLVDDDRRDELTAALDALRQPGIDIQLTGPWAPYSFTTLESDSSEGDERDGQ